MQGKNIMSEMCFEDFDEDRHSDMCECDECIFGNEEAENSISDNKRSVKNKPKVVCLCGSTRFLKAFREANFKLTLEGKIVLSIGCDFKSNDGLCLTEADKVRLDELHKSKIDLADEVMILNVDGYIGDSTRSELNYAIKCNKEITYLETF